MICYIMSYYLIFSYIVSYYIMYVLCYIIVRSSWESVQRMACEGLLDELRSIGSQSLKAVASGQPLPGGARLPMTDEAIYIYIYIYMIYYTIYDR